MIKAMGNEGNVAIESIHQQHYIENEESLVLLKIEIPQNIQLTFNISLKGREYDLFLLEGMI